MNNEGADQTAETVKTFLASRPKGLNGSSEFKSHHYQVYINKKFQRIIVNISILINLKICFGCSKEPSHRDGSFEDPQHLFWLRNKKIRFSLRTLN